MLLRRLLVLVFCCSCGAPVVVERQPGEQADAAVGHDVVPEHASPDAVAVAINASTATGDRDCASGLHVVYSQPQRTVLVPSNGDAPRRYTVAISADTAGSVSLWTQESMHCAEATLFQDRACAAGASGYPLFCNHGEWLTCEIYRKPAGESAWRLSRSGTVDFNQATYDQATGEYKFNFNSETWGAEGPNGCPGETATLDSYEFH